MAIQDGNVVRTAADLEKKYNFAKLLGLSKNIETNTETLIKVENELNNMLNSLVINLGDVLDTQSSISLWFYEGVPTTSNKPYTDWATPSDHYGDFYYDQNSGYVYKYTNTGWVLQTDTNLINAMALTNVELDVSTDHERQVYFSQPSPPYSSGDWWIQEDGTLMICQIGKASGTYEENDFINSSRYTSTVAVKQDDTLTVLKGTVTEITEDYVKFTDLSTAGSTTIAGDNITTGTIKAVKLQSTNYVSGSTGTKIDLSNGVIDSKNFKLDSSGNINVQGYITTANGILSSIHVESEKKLLGQPQSWYEGAAITRSVLALPVYIPTDFTPTSAYISLHTFKTTNKTYYDEYEYENVGVVQHIKAYKRGTGVSYYNDAFYGTFDEETPSTSDTALTAAFGSSGYTPVNGNYQKKISGDIKNNLTSGEINYIVLYTADAQYDPDTASGCQNSSRYTQYAFATLDIMGYTKV